MTLKRVGSLKNKKHKHCLQCGRVLVGLKDNTEHECSFCGQKHFVDIYGTTLVLTAAERPDLRHRKEIRKLPNTDDMYAYFVHFRYVNLKAAPGNKKPYYAMLDDMIEPINLEVVGEKKE